MRDQNIIEKLKERYSHLHPLILHRSIERSKSNGDLFDILDSLPDGFPLVWCESSSRWVKTTDIYQSKEFLGE
jgi:hypothetical protein